MFSLFLGIVLLIAAIVIAAIPLNEPRFPKKVIAGILATFAVIFGLSGGVSYNDAGVCSHIRTRLGTESSKCDIGWFFSGWGTVVEWPHAIAVQHSDVTQKTVSNDGTFYTLPVYSVRLADNWSGEISETSRFIIPQSEKEFLLMANKFRTPENLTNTLLIPTVNSSIDTVANLFTMEEYYSGGERDAFKQEFRDTVVIGPAITQKIDDPTIVQSRVSANALTPDTNEMESETKIQIVEKKTDQNGRDIRPEKNSYSQYGIVADSAILQNLNPDDAYEKQVNQRKEAIGRRVIAKDKRLEQEEQRLLAIAEADTQVATKQGIARQDQIERTTKEETEKKIAIITANRMKEQAEIEKQTSQINLEKAQIDSQAVIVNAEAEAKARELAIKADNALQSKLDAEIQIQKVWADAYSKRNVPQIVFGGGANGSPVGSDTEVKNFFDLMNAQAAKNLSYDRKVEPVK